MRLSPALTAVITGGASGIGLAFARTLVPHGAHVVIVDMDARAGQEAEAELRRIGPNSRVLFIQADITKEGALPRACAMMIVRWLIFLVQECMQRR